MTIKYPHGSHMTNLKKKKVLKNLLKKKEIYPKPLAVSHD